MTLVLSEGFDHLSVSELPAKNWATTGGGSGTFSTPAGRINNQCLSVTQSFSSLALGITKSLSGMTTTFYIGLAFKYANTTTGWEHAFLTTDVCQLYLNNAVGNTFIQVKTSGGTTIASGTTVLSANNWYYIELKIVCNGASGSCEVHLNGVSEISPTTGNFGSAAPTNITLWCTSSTSGTVATNYWDDIYVLNSSGTTNNTFLGDSRIETLWPAGDGAHLQWTPNSGTAHFSRVNETVADGDTSYVYDSTIGDRDSYTFGALSELSATVFAVKTVLYARKDNTSTKQICAVARPASTDYDGSTVTLGTSYSFYEEIREQNPATSAAWTISDVNGSQFGIKVVT